LKFQLKTRQTMRLNQSVKKKRRAETVNSQNMKTRMMVMVKKTTTRKESINGEKKVVTGTGTTKRIRRLTREEILCLTP
jgi:hypothetical protein